MKAKISSSVIDEGRLWYRKFNEMVMSKFLYGSPLLQIYVVEVCPSLHKKKYLRLQKLPFKKYVTILHYYLGGDFFHFCVLNVQQYQHITIIKFINNLNLFSFQ